MSPYLTNAIVPVILGLFYLSVMTFICVSTAKTVGRYLEQSIKLKFYILASIGYILFVAVLGSIIVLPALIIGD